VNFHAELKCGIEQGKGIANLSKFEQYYKLAAMLIEKATKEQLAECARLFALNLAHYRTRHGQLRLDENLTLVDMSDPTEREERKRIERCSTTVRGGT
jgi:hypothetical protein